ncbi:MAG: ferrous iron transport protein A [Deltaproteobacteria bacterium]|nr:ferrous iron transport protein A [Deltaproteobacteria bacterium]
MTLDEIRPGEQCRIKGIMATGILGQRLLDMGFIPGVQIEVIRNAPLIDPVEISLGEYQVSIRHDEARYVEVEPL